MNVHEPIGYLASLLVLATFCMRDMSTLRLVAIASNLAFIGYAVLADIVPVLLLHTLLLPINLYRFVQALPRQRQPGNPKREDLNQARLPKQHRPALGRPASLQVMEVGMKKRFFFISALMVLTLMAGCAPGTPTIASVSVSPSPATVRVGGTQTFTAVAKDANGNVVNASFTWTSSDTAVATIGATGVASAIAVGTTTITATTGGVSGSANLNVTQGDAPPPPPPPGDTTPPSIVSITPNNGSIGVNKNVKIVIDFSEAMNRQTTELAYQSADIPAVTFTWSNGDTRLEIDPVGDLEYTSAGKVYRFNLNNSATDLAGNKLAPVTSSFTTFRELTRTLTSVAALDGDVRGDGAVDTNGVSIIVGDSGASDNAQYKGFVSFDLSSFATEGLTVPGRITSAQLRVYQNGIAGTPYTDLVLGGKHLMAAHVDYGPSLNAADFSTSILHELGELSANAIVEYKLISDALESVRDDWANRASRNNRSQFMFFFARATDGDSVFDAARLTARESTTNPPELRVTFLVP